MLTSTACAQHAPAPRASDAYVAPTSTASAVPVAVAPVQTPTRVPSATPAPTVAPTPTPSPRAASTRAASTPESMPVTTPLPFATPTAPIVTIMNPVLSPVLVPPDAAPRIIKVDLSNQTVHAGDTISGTVETTSNVASVEARIATFSISVPKVGVGRFSLNYVVPNVPFFFHGTYPMTVIARNAAGMAVTRVIQITVD